MGGSNLSIGSFSKAGADADGDAEADPNLYDISLMSVLSCSADVIIGSTAMQVNCGSNCTINLIKLSK